MEPSGNFEFPDLKSSSVLCSSAGLSQVLRVLLHGAEAKFGKGACAVQGAGSGKFCNRAGVVQNEVAKLGCRVLSKVLSRVQGAVQSVVQVRPKSKMQCLARRPNLADVLRCCCAGMRFAAACCAECC